MDKKAQFITPQKVIVKENSDAWIQVHSEAKAMKETEMHGRFSERFEQGLKHIQEGILKKGGTKKEKRYGNI